MSGSVIAAAPDWSLERAAAEMSHRGVRHLVVFEDGELVGVLSMRDIVQRLDQRGSHVGNDPRLRCSSPWAGVMVSTGSTAPRTFCLRGRR